MQNAQEIKDFLNSQASNEEKARAIKELPELLASFVQALMSGENKEFYSKVKSSGEEYIAFIEKYYDFEFHNTLLFTDSYLVKLFARKNVFRDFSLSILADLNMSPLESLLLIQELTGKDPLPAVYISKDKKLGFEDTISQYIYLIPEIQVSEDDDLELVSSVMDEVPMELTIKDKSITAVVLNKARSQVEAKAEAIYNKAMTILTRIVSSPVTKYAGIALAIGVALTGTAEAGVGDAVKVIESANQSLQPLMSDLPAGCEMGVKMISKNAFGITYEMEIGDYVVRTEYFKAGNVSEKMDQTLFKLKELKNCGFSKQDVLELAEKLQGTVKKAMSR